MASPSQLCYYFNTRGRYLSWYAPIGLVGFESPTLSTNCLSSSSGRNEGLGWASEKELVVPERDDGNAT